MTEDIYYQKYLKYKEKYLELKQKAGASVYKNTTEAYSNFSKGTATGIGIGTAGVLYTPVSALVDIGSGIYSGVSSVIPKGQTPEQIASAAHEASTKEALKINQKCATIYRNYLSCQVCNKNCDEPNKNIRNEQCKTTAAFREGAQIYKHIQDTRGADNKHFCEHIHNIYPGGDLGYINGQAKQIIN